MSTLTQPLRDEHQGILPQIEHIREVADLIGYADQATVFRAVEEVYAFLADDLIPHAEGEDAGLYAAVAKVLHCPESVATMRRDHVEMGRLTGDLISLRHEIGMQPMTEAQIKAMRRLLYGIYTIVSLHLAKEEEIYFALLDARMDPADVSTLFESMEHIAATFRKIDN